MGAVVEAAHVGPDGGLDQTVDLERAAPSSRAGPLHGARARAGEAERSARAIRAKQSDPLARSGRFHILQVPQGIMEEGRRVKSGKKKKHLQ
jgi:hypothetical protein